METDISFLRSEQLKVKLFTSPPGGSLRPYDSPNICSGISHLKTVTLSDILVTRLCLAHTHTHAYVIVITSLFLDFFSLAFSPIFTFDF